MSGKPGTLFLVEGEPANLRHGAARRRASTVRKFDLTKRKAEKLVDDVEPGSVVSHDGEKMLYRQGESGSWSRRHRRPSRATAR